VRYAARCDAGVTEETPQMYYETEMAFKMLYVKRKPRAPKKYCQALFFDLNHCNSKHEMVDEIDYSRYTIVVLDHTSSTWDLVSRTLQAVFAHSGVELVLLVDSGLKNEQGGFDMNPHGILRIMTRDRDLTESLYEDMKATDEAAARHPAMSHAIRRAYKHAGMAPTTRDLLGLLRRKPVPLYAPRSSVLLASSSLSSAPKKRKQEAMLSSSSSSSASSASSASSSSTSSSSTPSGSPVLKKQRSGPDPTDI
jgi:hypothetical protein